MMGRALLGWSGRAVGLSLVAVGALSLGAVGCGDKERFPRRPVDLSPNDGFGGSGGANGEEDKGVEGGTPQAPQDTGDPVYLYAESATDKPQKQVCDVETGALVGTAKGDLQYTIGQVHPETFELWTLNGGEDEVKGIAAHPDVCRPDVEDFAFHPKTGALASTCGSGWVDEEGNALPVAAKYRDEEGRYLVRSLGDNTAALFDAEGTLIQADLNDIEGIHSRPGGGFWVMSVSGNTVTRGEILPDGTEGEVVSVVYDAGVPSDSSLGLDNEGRGYFFALGSSASKSVYRTNAAFTSFSVVYEPGSCDLLMYWGSILTTP